jgi:hypothetical protein
MLLSSEDMALDRVIRALKNSCRMNPESLDRDYKVVPFYGIPFNQGYLLPAKGRKI